LAEGNPMRREGLPSTPISTRTPPSARAEESHRRTKSAAKTADLAFADTVIVDDLDAAVPPSGILFNDATGAEQRMTALAFPPVPDPQPIIPHALYAEGVRTRFHQAYRRVREGVEEQRAEMTLLWTATAAIAQRDAAQAPGLGRRLRTLVSFFEWDRADVLRAAWIGLAVFFFAATVGAVVMQVGSP
jgi:hypothetical protein